MATIKETVQYIRSKNAGPFWLTIDLFCDSDEAYEKLTKSDKMNADTIAAVYGIDEESINIFMLPKLRVVKISFPRKVIQGTPEDADMHGGQQYLPLLDVEI